MPRPHNERFVIADRRQKIAARYLRGEPQHTIAQAFELNQGTICRDLAAIRLAWMESSVRDFDAHKAQELAKIDEIERAAWIGWSKSQEPAESVHAEEFGEKKKSSVTRKGQAGDPRFLKVVLECVQRRCAILGLDAEKRLKISGLDAYAKLSDADLDHRIALAQSRLAGGHGSADQANGNGGDMATAPRPPNGGPG